MRGCLSAAAAGVALWLSAGGRRQKLLPTVVAAKVERLSIAFGVESSRFVHGHSADGVFSRGFRFFHGHVPLPVCRCHCPWGKPGTGTKFRKTGEIRASPRLAVCFDTRRYGRSARAAPTSAYEERCFAPLAHRALRPRFERPIRKSACRICHCECNFRTGGPHREARRSSGIKRLRRLQSGRRFPAPTTRSSRLRRFRAIPERHFRSRRDWTASCT